MKPYLPIIFGLILATASIIMGQIPLAIAQFSGISVIGDHIGYLWAALIVAWLYHESWRKSFAASFITVFIANVVYYIVLIAFYLFDITPFALPPLHYLRSFAFWMIVACVVCILAATAVWMARHANSRLLRYGIFFVAYLGIIVAMFWSNRFFIISWQGIRAVSPIYNVQTLRLMGHFFEIGFALIMTTLILGFGYRTAFKEMRGRAE